MKIKNLFLLAALGLMASATLTSCEDVLGHWEKPTPTPITPTVEEAIMYGFKVTDLAGVDRTEAVNSLKMSTDDGLIAEAEVSGGKITIKAEKLSGITSAIDFWFEAEIGGQPYIAKVNIDPTALSPETDKTLEMATLGDVILKDGTFAARSSTGANVAMIAYLGSSTGVDGYTHGLALALTNVGMGTWEGAKTYCSTTMNSNTPVTGATWLLASQDQWDNMISACKNVLGNKNTYEDLRDGFSGIAGATNLQSNKYWSSTEQDASNAYYYMFNEGSWSFGSKDNSENRWIRACLAF